ncbi:MAG: phosphoribosylformylglycinamidine synthase subunit PurS [Candidatus Methanofastidiosia archaeon]
MGKKEVSVTVGLKEGISDPEGKNVKKALSLLGFKEVEEVKILKSYKITINENKCKNIEEKVKAMAEGLLTNPVVHDYEISW